MDLEVVRKSNICLVMQGMLSEEIAVNCSVYYIKRPGNSGPEEKILLLDNERSTLDRPFLFHSHTAY